MKAEKKIVYPRVIQSAGAEFVEELTKEKILQIGLSEKEVTTVKAGGYVLLDFGMEYAGGIRTLVFSVSENAKMRLRLGESVSECCSEVGEKNSGNAHTYRDITVSVVALSDCSFFDGGFRFLRVDAIGGTVSFKSIVAEVWTSEIPVKGSFSCSDPLLNKIYETSARTVQLCVRRGMIWDGIKRDRLVWIGDIYPETLALANITDDLSSVTRSLDFEKSQTPPTEWMDSIPMYSLWWLIILREYYRRTGDKEYLHRQGDYISVLIDHIFGCVKESGETCFPYNFVDWPTHEKEDELAGVHFLTEIAVSAATDILGELHDEKTLDKCIRLTARLKNLSPTVVEKKQIVALKLFAGRELSEREKEILMNGGAKGVSTFMSYFIFSAMDKIGGTRRVTEILKEYYGGMLNMGATSFWEDFDVDWTDGACPVDRLPRAGERDIHGDFGAYCYLGYRHSLCHGWSSGVLAYIVERILGVKSNDDGTVSVSPFLGDLQWIKGDVPLKNGVLHIETEKDGKLIVNAPRGVKVVYKRFS